MNTLWDQLDALRAIVDTAQADDIEQQPEAIRTRYEPYAQAYFAIEAVKRVEERLIGELRAGKSVTGYLSADFGYGKTATAIYLWKECLDSGIVAVPPFLFRQLKGLMQATRGWLAYLLQHTQPTLLPGLEETYRQHAERSVDELAKDIAARQGISEAKARAIVQEHIANRRDVTTTQSLLEFLRDAVGIAQEAHFKGLVVFADELQEFVRTEEGSRNAIQMLSELVKGVRAMANVPLGLMLAMPVNPTESAIEEQAGDIMQRMRERGTALKLEDAYGREFPKDLWEHLSQKFGDGGTGQAVEERTLEALGQLCERKDLSNGPRTVMNAFKRIAQHYQQTHRPYSPIDLMDDYLHGHIVFEGREAKLTGTLRQLLGLPAVRNDAQCQQAVKLLAAFPRGVNEEKAGHLYAVIQNLADQEQWLGEHITQLAEGYALTGLQEHGEARPLLDEIVRDFRRRWYHSWTERYKAQLAASGFIYEIVPLLFPTRAQGQYANFSGHAKLNGYKNLEQDIHGVPYMLLEGCFERLFSRFPDRKVYVSVSTEADDLNRFRPPDADFDLDVRFFLELPDDTEADTTPTRIVSANQDGRIDIHLNLKRTFGQQFPAELGFLHNIMSPERTSAEALLGLSMRMWGWLQEHPETSETDRQMIESQRRALHRYVLQLLLPDANEPAKVQAIGIKVSGAEQRLMESIFEAKCSERYPQYKPLMITKEWKSHLQRYRDVLSRRPLAERRGRQPFVGTKQEIASEFRGALATFEAQSRNLREMGIFELLDWRGRGEESTATVLFKEHPLEVVLREALQQQGHVRSVNVGGHAKQVNSLEISTLQKVARRQGYLPAEVDEAIALLELRQYIERQPDGTVQEFAGILDADELRHQASEMEGRLGKLAAHFHDELHSYERLLRESREHLVESEDEVVLDTAQRKLHELQVRLDEFIKAKSRELAKRLSSLGEELDRRSAEFQPHELDQQMAGAVGFVRHVDDLRKKLGQQFRELSRQWDLLQESVSQSEQRARTIGDEDDLLGLLAQVTQYEQKKQHLDGELKRLQPYLAGLQHWRSIVAEATTLRDRLDLDNPLRQRLDDDVSQAILENFAVRQLEALLDWERFKASVEAIESEITTEENRQRSEFHQRKEQYEQVLGQLMPQRMIQAIFDPKDPGQSYQVLYQGALRKLREWLHEQHELAQSALNELDYLIRERSIAASDERDAAEHVLTAFQRAAGQLNQGLIEDLEQFQAYCNELQGNWEQLRAVQNNLAHKRTAKDPPTDEEKPLLEVLSTQRRSLEDLRRGLPANMATIEMLFERLRELYRKGHIEVEVRKRE